MSQVTEPTRTALTTTANCQDLAPEDRARIMDAARAMLRARGPVVRVGDFLGGRLERMAGFTGHRILVRAESHLQGPIERALWRGYRLATFGLDREQARARLRTTRLAASASGVVSGLFGIPGLAVDLPFTTTAMLRSIAAIARESGEDIRDPDTRRACIEVFMLGGLPGEDNDVELRYWTTRATLTHATIGLTIRQSARFLAVPLSEKLLAQAVPLVGAVAGGTLNYAFMEYFQQIARAHFALRAVERHTGDPAMVRACLHEAVDRLRSAPRHAA